MDKMAMNLQTIVNQDCAIAKRLLQMGQLINGMRTSELSDNIFSMAKQHHATLIYSARNNDFNNVVALKERGI